MLKKRRVVQSEKAVFKENDTNFSQTKNKMCVGSLQSILRVAQFLKQNILEHSKFRDD